MGRGQQRLAQAGDAEALRRLAGDVLVYLSGCGALMVAAGLVGQLIADVLRLPRMLVLLAVGVLLGPSVTDAIEVPLDSMGPQILLTLGVSFILFYGGLNLSARLLSRAVVGLALLSRVRAGGPTGPRAA